MGPGAPVLNLAKSEIQKGLFVPALEDQPIVSADPGLMLAGVVLPSFAGLLSSAFEVLASAVQVCFVKATLPPSASASPVERMRQITQCCSSGERFSITSSMCGRVCSINHLAIHKYNGSMAD